MTADRFPRTVFFGTPDFAAASLQALLDAGVDVPLVVTQPDRPVGRHAELRPSAVAALAASRGIPTEKPETLKANAGFVARLREARPEAIAVVAYGRILPPEILGLPRLGCVNVHASLLPRWRGASPIQAAILAGDAETGVVTMRMEEGLDTGPVYLQRRVTIGEHETSGELSGRLQLLGGALLVETLEGLAAGRLSPSPQAGDSTATATVCRPIRREDALVDWERPAAEIVRRLAGIHAVARPLHVPRRRASQNPRRGRSQRAAWPLRPAPSTSRATSRKTSSSPPPEQERRCGSAACSARGGSP